MLLLWLAWRARTVPRTPQYSSRDCLLVCLQKITTVLLLLLLPLVVCRNSATHPPSPRLSPHWHARRSSFYWRGSTVFWNDIRTRTVCHLCRVACSSSGRDRWTNTHPGTSRRCPGRPRTSPTLQTGARWLAFFFSDWNAGRLIAVRRVAAL